MKAATLFSGIGGFDLPLQRKGVELGEAVEIDKYARSVYSRHFPGGRLWQDATKFEPERLSKFDILACGPPCQSFSVAGNRRGFTDTRGTLFYEVFRIAKEKQPSIIIIENVLGLLNHDSGETFRTILKALDEVGYAAEWQVLNSKFFVPQNRERVFIIGHLRGKRIRKIFPIGGTNPKSNGKNLMQVGNIDQKGHNSIWGRVYSPDGISSTINAQGGGLGAKSGLYAVSSGQAHASVMNNRSPALTAKHEQVVITVPVLTRPNKSQNGRIIKTHNEPSFTLTAQDKNGIFNGKGFADLRLWSAKDFKDSLMNGPNMVGMAS